MCGPILTFRRGTLYAFRKVQKPVHFWVQLYLIVTKYSQKQEIYLGHSYNYFAILVKRVFSRAFSSAVRQMPDKTRKDGARPAIFLIFVLFYVFFVLLRSLYCLCVYAHCTTATGLLLNCS